nr:MAG TPA: hypothetical protein [Caudoviricetes sp.]
MSRLRSPTTASDTSRAANGFRSLTKSRKSLKSWQAK